MLQNPTIEAAIIAAIALILGSLLTIVGGFFGNYFLQTFSDRKENERVRNEAITRSFLDTKTVYDSYIGIITRSQFKKETDIVDLYKALKDAMFEIRMLVQIHLQEIEEDFVKYEQDIFHSMVIVLDDEKLSGGEKITWASHMSLNGTELQALTNAFRSALIKTSKR